MAKAFAWYLENAIKIKLIVKNIDRYNSVPS